MPCAGSSDGAYGDRTRDLRLANTWNQGRVGSDGSISVKLSRQRQVEIGYSGTRFGTRFRGVFHWRAFDSPDRRAPSYHGGCHVRGRVRGARLRAVFLLDLRSRPHPRRGVNGGATTSGRPSTSLGLWASDVERVPLSAASMPREPAPVMPPPFEGAGSATRPFQTSTASITLRLRARGHPRSHRSAARVRSGCGARAVRRLSRYRR
jgi:hypothetical protein